MADCSTNEEAAVTDTTSDHGFICNAISVLEETNCGTTPVEVKDGDSCMETLESAEFVAHMSQANESAKESKPVISPAIRVNMLARVAVSNAHFKHQQRGEPDLTLQEKIEITQNILDSNKVLFLSKFWNFLELEDLEFFQDSRHVFEIDFYVKQVMKAKNKGLQRNKVKNRRYEAMKELISQGDYFSEDEMKFREPYLYDQMVGQYLTDDEIQAKVDKSDLTFSNILLKHIDILNENARFEHAKDVEQGQMEENESDDEEDDDEDEETNMEDDDEDEETNMEDDDEGKPKIPEKQRQTLRVEFLTLMQEKFLQGDDKNFDYSKVDNNEAYDDLSTLNADAEEKYFEDEDPESVHSDSNQ